MNLDKVLYEYCTKIFKNSFYTTETQKRYLIDLINREIRFKSDRI